MLIVINICKDDFEEICMQSRMVKDLGSMQGRIRDAIFHSTPLPKGHGRIGDLDRLYNVFEKNVVSADAFKELFDHAPTIIEADEVAKQDVIAIGNKSEYERGLNDAEKAVKRVINEPSRGGLYANEMQKIFGTKGTFSILLRYSISEIIKKIREYDNKKQVNNRCDTCKYQHLDREHFPCCDCCDNDRWEAEDDEIHVGDEVYCLNPTHKYVVLGFLDNGKIFVLSGKGLTGSFALNQVHKTGRNYPVMEILEKLNQLNESEE